MRIRIVGDLAARPDADRRLAAMNFVVSDWARAGQPFGPRDFNALVDAGYVTVDEVASDATTA